MTRACRWCGAGVVIDDKARTVRHLGEVCAGFLDACRAQVTKPGVFQTIEDFLTPKGLQPFDGWEPRELGALEPPREHAGEGLDPGRPGSSAREASVEKAPPGGSGPRSSADERGRKP